LVALATVGYERSMTRSLGLGACSLLLTLATGCSSAPQVVGEPSSPPSGAQAVVSDVALIALQLMSVRDGHGGPQYFPIDGEPIVGEPHMVEATLTKKMARVELEVSAQDGTVLSTLPLKLGQTDAIAGVSMEGLSVPYVAELTVPTKDFVLTVVGTTLDGKPFSVRANAYRPQLLELRTRYMPDMFGGQTIEYKVELKNYGPADRFEVSLTDSLGFLRSPEKQELRLATRQGTTLLIELALPIAEENALLNDQLLVAVRSVSEPRAQTSTMANITVVPGRDTDGDFFADEDDNCPQVKNSRQEDEDGDGLGDECDPRPRRAAKQKT
jgi:hypothetical protein